MNTDRAGAYPSAVMLQGAVSQVGRAIFYSFPLFEASSHPQFPGAFPLLRRTYLPRRHFFD
jgi:hypothetical protein